MVKMKSEIENNFALKLLDVEDETFQSRFDYDENKIENLAKDIKKFGQREPIGIRESSIRKGLFQIIYGFQRVKAVKLLGRDTINAQVYKEIGDRECRELSVRDNEMHGDLTQVEKALQCKRLKNEGWTIEELCEAFNTKKSAVYNWFKVADLDKITLGLIHHEYISVYHGLELAKLDFSRRLEKLRTVVGWNLSVRELKNLIQGKGVTMMLGLNGWVSNCWRDLRWKNIEKCQKCEYYRGIKEKNNRKTVECVACDSIDHPKVIRDFLEKIYKR